MRNQLIIAVCLGLGIYFGFYNIKLVPKPEVTPIVASAPVAVKAASPVSTGVMHVQDASMERETFEFTRHIGASFLEKDSKQGKPVADMRYAGKLLIEWKDADEKTGNKSRVGNFSLRLKEGSVAPLFVEATFDTPYTVKTVREPKARDEKEEDTIAILKDLISIYAFKTNEDTTGKYEAFVSTEGNLTKKQKIRYESPTLANLQILKSLHEAWLDSKNKIVKMEGSEEIKMSASAYEKKTPSKDGLMVSFASYSMKRIPTGLSQQTTLNSDIELHDTTLALESKARGFHHVNYDDIKFRLAGMDQLSRVDQLKLFQDLVNALKTDPSKIADFIDWIRANAGNPSKVNMGIGVLATLGTPDAQQALINLYFQYAASPDTQPYCHTILASFTTATQELTDHTRLFLVNQAFRTDDPQIAANAAYALGSALKIDPDALSERKLNYLASHAATPEWTQTYLDAIGNSGDTNLLPVVEKNLQAQDVNIREKAVFALRFMNEDEARPLLVQALSDPAVDVQYAAVKAISLQSNPLAYSDVLQQCSGSRNANLSHLCEQVLKDANGS